MSITSDLGNCSHNNMLNLQVVDDAFGVHADLYQDCLRVSTNATSREIQHAFLAQRRELIRKLEQGEDCNKQMDAVVLAVRILNDAELRAQYDDMRFERMQRTQTQEHLQQSASMNTSYNKMKSTRDKEGGNDPSVAVQDREMQFTQVDLVDTSFDSEVHNYSAYSHRIHCGPKRQTRIVTPEPISSKVDDATVYTYDDTVDQTLDQTMDDMTVLSGETHLIPRNQTLLDRIANECIGALEDTSKSLEEVFSVFTLQDEEIDAVVKRINKAKRQMNWTV